jgi:hypothetical protein
LFVARQSQNSYTYQQLAHDRVVLQWTKLDEAEYYKIYKYNSKKKKYILYKILSWDKASLKITGLSPTKTYYFKVKAYCNDGVKTSKSLKVKTLTKTTGYFYKKVVFDSDWSGVLITNEKATNAQMARYKINGKKGAVKYNYSKKNKTLYVHVYAKFVGKGVNQKFAYYKKTSSGYKQYKLSQYTNKQLAISGIQQRWNVYVRGNSYNFISGCNFNTKVIFHTQDIQQDQHYITVNIGNEECYYGGIKQYWFFVAGAVNINDNNPTYNYTGYDVDVSLPTNHQLKLNKGRCTPLKNITAFKDCAAHEFGHILGLDDSYELVDDGWVTDRIKQTTEIGYYKNGQFNNIMYSSDNTHAVANDIEMALQGQGMAINGEAFSWQSYIDYTADCNYKQSTVIRKK